MKCEVSINLFCIASSELHTRSLLLVALTVHALSAKIAEDALLRFVGVEVMRIKMWALSGDLAQVRCPIHIREISVLF